MISSLFRSQFDGGAALLDPIPASLTNMRINMPVCDLAVSFNIPHYLGDPLGNRQRKSAIKDW
jgi:hypothetical protein